MPRPRRRQRYNRRKAYSAMSTAGKALNLALGLKKLINVEHKKYTVSVGALPSNAGVNYALTTINQGDNDAERDGLSVKAQSLYMRATIRKSGGSVRSFLRVVITKDNQQVADTIPTWTNVFQSLSINAPLNAQAIGRFTILYDKVINLSDARDTQVYLEKYIKLNHHVRWNGVSGNDIQKGGLTVHLLSDETTNVPSYDAIFRTTYVDN